MTDTGLSSSRLPYLSQLYEEQIHLSELKTRLLSINAITESEWNFLLNYNNMYAKCHEFTQQYLRKMNKPNDGKIDRDFIKQMVQDEMQELDRARDLAEEIDAIVDAVYYMLQHVSRTHLPFNDVFRLVHYANMTKFGPGGNMLPNGKWQKPPNFVPPDEDIRQRLLDHKI